MTGRRRYPRAELERVIAAAKAAEESKQTLDPAGRVDDDSAYRAHQLRLAGLPWEQVATETGYASARVAQMAVSAYLQKAALGEAAEQRHAAFHTEMDRLTALHAAYWPPALQGDIRAANLALKAAALRAKLQGLEPRLRDGSDNGIDEPEVMVISGSEEEYRAQLQALVDNEREAIAELWG